MRIAFVTDVHLNATPAGWQQQARWCEGIPCILGALREQVQRDRIDLVIYGGDLVERGTPEAIEQAAITLAAIPARAIVCLGNHDLTRGDSLASWRSAMRHWPQATLADALVELPALDLIALNNAWTSGEGETDYRWDGKQPAPAILAEQFAQLDDWLLKNPSRPAILAVHAPLFPLPPELTGGSAPSEVQPGSYTSPLLGLAVRHPRLRLVLAGHCHAACATQFCDSAVHLCATSLTEVPHQFPLLEVQDSTIRISTRTLCTAERKPEVNPGKLWVMGRPADREFSIPLQF